MAMGGQPKTPPVAEKISETPLIPAKYPHPNPYYIFKVF